MVKAITAKQAKKMNEHLGLSMCDNDGGDKTFWAYDEEHGEIYDFDNKRERDEFVESFRR